MINIIYCNRIISYQAGLILLYSLALIYISDHVKFIELGFICMYIIFTGEEDGMVNS